MAIPNPMISIKQLSISAGCIACGILVSNDVVAGSEEDVNQSIELQPDQPQAQNNLAEHDSLVGFFAIGVVINIVLVTAYFIWAYRQWKKKK